MVTLLLGLILTVPVDAARQPVRARHGMVVAMEAIAVDVGVSVLQKGGNAIDAAVAVGFAMAVTHPFAGNIGGGGYMLIRLADGRTTFIDFRERAPQKSTHDMYLDSKGAPTRDSIEGWRSSGVPGTVRGFELAVSKYGKRTWAENMAPAVELASKGFPVSYPLAEWLKGSKSLASSPESKRIFQKNGAFFDVGETLTQPELAQTLQRISKNGPSEFYEGETAKRFAAEMASHGGIITLEDLKNYKAIERTPLSGTYHGYTVITSPPSSSGGTALLEMLGILDGTGYEKGGAGSASSIHYLAESMRRAYADRNEYIGDPDFVKVPIAGLLDKTYLAKLRSTIDPERATPSDQVRPGKPTGTEQMETTHYSVVDSEGNAVAVTYTLNGGYGNGITVPGLGFLLNNEMDDFTVEARHAEHVWPGARRGQRDSARQTPALVDDADHHRQGRQAVHDRRRARRRAHLDRRAAGDPERDRFRHERAGRRRCAARPPSMAARQALARTRHLAGHRRAAQEPRIRRGLFPRRRPRPGGRHRQRRRVAAGRIGWPVGRRQGGWLLVRSSLVLCPSSLDDA